VVRILSGLNSPTRIPKLLTTVSIYRCDGVVAEHVHVGAGGNPRDGADGVAGVAFSDGAAVRGATDPAGAWVAAAGLSVTRPRRLVMAVLEGRDRAHTAAEVSGLLRAGGTGVGLTSVYRILREFSVAGLVHVFPGTEQRFRLCSPPEHVHLVCDRCGRVIEAPADQVSAWLAPTRRAAGFVVDVVHTDIHGACDRCRHEAVG
jgi:Fur family ferric uptake transcriptional regulator